MSGMLLRSLAVGMNLKVTEICMNLGNGDRAMTFTDGDGMTFKIDHAVHDDMIRITPNFRSIYHSGVLSSHWTL